MNRILKTMFRPLLLGLLLVAYERTIAQEAPPYRGEINEFLKKDSISAPPKNAILFVGSSSFRMWDSLQAAFPNHTVINRGFGGSNLRDLSRYVNEIVIPYQPKQVVIYSGENDLAPGDITADTVVERFIHAFTLIRKGLPNVPILYVSIKPSPSRMHLVDKMLESNRRIRGYLQKQSNAKFIDVFSLMLDKNGKPLKDIFLADDLHMNSRGYAIWKKAIEPHLIK